MSERTAEKLNNTLKSNGRWINLEGAVPGVHTTAILFQNVNVKLGNGDFNRDIYAAPIEEDFILGLDSTKVYHNCVVDLEHCELSINEETIGANLKKQGSDVYHVSRVKTSKRTVIPPQTSINIKCYLEYPILEKFMIEPRKQKNKPNKANGSMVKLL